MAFPENTVNDTGIKHIWDKVTAALSGKVDKVSGKGLSTNDYTTAEKEKLSGIEAGAQVNAVTSVAGKTGAVTLDKADVGLGNVDNTSDASKPISTATQNALDTKADTSEVAGTQTATGNPITLTDASETYAQGLTVELEPKQDLHGYDFPWVGGAGKNKLPLDLATIKSSNTGGTWSGNVYTINGVTFTILTDDGGNVIGIKANGTASSNTYLYVAKNLQDIIPHDGTMVLSGCNGGGSTTYALQVYFESGFANCFDDDTTVQASTATSQVLIVVRNRYAIPTGGITFYPMIRLSTETDDTFAPWENICPISGYEGVEVEDVGVNQWDEEWELGDYNNSGQAKSVNYCIRSKQDDYIPVLGNTVYYAKCSEYIYPCFYDINKTFISKIQVNAYTTFTTPANARYMRFVIHGNYGTTYNHDISINYPSTDTDYHPYQSRTASVTFGQTVYGGKSDFTDGGTDDEWNKYDTYSGWYKASTETTVIINSIAGKKSGTNQIYCNTYKYVANQGFGVPLGAISDSTNSTYLNYIFINDSRFAGKTVQECQAILESDGMYFVYQVETPTQLSTPPTDLKILQDTHNLTTNGTTITLDYIPNNSIGDAVKASEEYTDRAVERVAVAPKATLIDTWMISEESDTISVDLTSYDCNFFLLEYLFMSKRGTTLIPRPQGGTFSASVVTYNNGTALYIELDYNPTTKQLSYTSNITSQFGILAIYTI